MTHNPWWLGVTDGDRRRRLRIPLRLAATLRHAVGTVPGWIESVSGAGACFVTGRGPVEIPPGSQIGLVVASPSPGTPTRLHYSARVLRVEDATHEGERRIVYALEFREGLSPLDLPLG